MSLRKKGIDLEHLWERKRQQIELTPGLSVWRGGETFADVGGLGNVKKFLRLLIDGSDPPNAVIWVDEIEKLLAGSSGQFGDSSGVSQGILQSLLTHLQDTEAAGMIFVGPPGAGKSLVCKTVGAEAGVPTIAFDSNAMKGSLVGQSEQNIRAALKVVEAVSNGKALWVATCNRIASLPPELRRRFSFGTFFFDLPDEDEREAIVEYYAKVYDLVAERLRPTAGQLNIDGWTGAELKTLCVLTSRLQISMYEASQYIVPVCRSAKTEIDELRKQATGRFISASREGVYNVPRNGKRALEVI